MQVFYVSHHILNYFSADEKLSQMTGPGTYEQWTSWKYRTPEQSTTLAIKTELERLLGNEKARKSQLSSDELTAINKNLQAQKVVGVSDDLIRQTWHHVYRKQFLTRSINTARMCRKAFAFYQKSLSPEECGVSEVNLAIQTQKSLIF